MNDEIFTINVPSEVPRSLNYAELQLYSLIRNKLQDDHEAYDLASGAHKTLCDTIRYLENQVRESQKSD